MAILVPADQIRTDKKNRIVEAAVIVFAQKGYASAKIADIAAGAEIGKGTIYEYFASKEDLFFAVFEWFKMRTEDAARVNIAVLGGSAAKRLEALSDSLMGMWHEIKDVFTLTMEFWAASSSSQMRDRFKANFRNTYQEFRNIVKSLIWEGIERGEFRTDINPESVAAALVGTWDALFLQAWFEDDFDPVTIARDFLSVLIKGLQIKGRN
jgi:AcrR family transcriptional regulator